MVVLDDLTGVVIQRCGAAVAHVASLQLVDIGTDGVGAAIWIDRAEVVDRVINRTRLIKTPGRGTRDRQIARRGTGNLILPMAAAVLVRRVPGRAQLRFGSAQRCIAAVIHIMAGSLVIQHTTAFDVLPDELASQGMAWQIRRRDPGATRHHHDIAVSVEYGIAVTVELVDQIGATVGTVARRVVHQIQRGTGAAQAGDRFGSTFLHQHILVAPVGDVDVEDRLRILGPGRHSAGNRVLAVQNGMQLRICVREIVQRHVFSFRQHRQLLRVVQGLERRQRIGRRGGAEIGPGNRAVEVIDTFDQHFAHFVSVGRVRIVVADL